MLICSVYILGMLFQKSNNVKKSVPDNKTSQYRAVQIVEKGDKLGIIKKGCYKKMETTLGFKYGQTNRC